MKSWIEISAEHLRANFRAIQQAAGLRFQLLCVLKADAYGHGAAICAPLLVGAGAPWLGVADLEEGRAVRQALAKAGLADRNTHLLVMCGFEPGDASGLVEADLTPVIWTTQHVDALERAAAAANRHIAVHVELDTGMARQGVVPGGALDQLAERLRASPWVRYEGLFSHLSSSEVAHSPVTLAQQQRFQLALAFEPSPPAYLHLGNSSALDEGSTLPWLLEANVMGGEQLLVRPGLALYGYALPLQGGPAAQARLAPQLQAVATWKTRITGLRDLDSGDTVGYGATFTAAHPMRLALLPVGYADGFRREASSGVGNGWVRIHGQKAPVVGRVSMNLTVVDVTHHDPAPALGDEVILLGEGVTAHDHAAWCHTIAYEILCGMRGHRRVV